MTRINWNEGPKRPYTGGVDRGVLYIPDAAGIPWSGLREVTESSPDVIVTQTYIDGQKVQVRRKETNYEATLKVLTYPFEFEPYSGSGHGLKLFNFSYRVMTGPDTYRIHLLYNIVATPDDISYSTLGDEIDPTIFSWTLSTRPVKLAGRASSSHLIIDSSTTNASTLEAIENQLYGGEGVIPNLPTPDSLLQIFEEHSVLKVVDNGDGTVTITGPDEAIEALSNQRTQLTWPSVINLSTYEYQVSSL